MSFQAYLDNIQAKTGKSPADFKAMAADKGFSGPAGIADGVKACKYFSEKGIKTNVTLVFSPGQALLAAKAGATYVSPFIGRLDDVSTDGLNLISEIRLIYDNYSFETQILAASVRHTMHIIDCAKIGADVMTGPLSAITGLLKHPLTDSGLAKFLADYQKGN